MRISEKHPQAVNLSIDILSGGGIAILPCDTIYGIIGLMPDSEDRIRSIKGRGESKHFIVFLPGRDVKPVSDIELTEKLLKFWPGPLTLIVPMRGGGTIGVRIPADPFLQKVLRGVGKPLYSTSVNRSGQPPLWNINSIVEEFSEEVDLIVDGGNHPGGIPSTVLDVTKKPYTVLRQGEIIIPEDLL
ncbi:MAG: L-threonylcarbamoyladenylate synthase [Spirochaetales bacterium]|nr:L-threonylcarbamoyladenylate synthase [Spirochaetales bacterium]